jgi:hypothetical protein
MASDQPVDNVSSSSSLPTCKRVVQLNTATVNGHEYDITGPERETIMADMLVMDANAFAAKWASVYRGVSNEPSAPTPTVPKTPISSIMRTLAQSGYTGAASTVNVSGHDYDITGPEREAIVVDMLFMDVDAFAAKWASARTSREPES